VNRAEGDLFDSPLKTRPRSQKTSAANRIWSASPLVSGERFAPAAGESRDGAMRTEGLASDSRSVDTPWRFGCSQQRPAAGPCNPHATRRLNCDHSVVVFGGRVWRFG
jgi:hypothetical protein